jgi:hypothetical protein
MKSEAAAPVVFVVDDDDLARAVIQDPPGRLINANSDGR